MKNVISIAFPTLGANMRPYKYNLPFAQFSQYSVLTPQQIDALTTQQSPKRFTDYTITQFSSPITRHQSPPELNHPIQIQIGKLDIIVQIHEYSLCLFIINKVRYTIANIQRFNIVSV